MSKTNCLIVDKKVTNKWGGEETNKKTKTKK